jgi:nucleoside-diphosphate-sugar epimerase
MLGRQLVAQLEAEGIPVVRVGRAATDDVAFDLSSDWSEAGFHGTGKADVLFHCAAAFGGDDPEGMRVNFRVNAFGNLGVLGLAEHLGCKRCVFAGSVFSFADSDSAGMSSYGLSKAQGEQLLEWGLARKCLGFCSLRFPQLYDSRGLCRRHQPWFARIIAYASRGQDLRLPPATATRNFLHVSDAAGMMLEAAKGGITGTWPLRHGEQWSYRQIAEMAYREFGRGGSIVDCPEKEPFREFRFPTDAGLPGPLRSRRLVSMAEGLAMIHMQGEAGSFGPLDVQ